MGSFLEKAPEEPVANQKITSGFLWWEKGPVLTISEKEKL